MTTDTKFLIGLVSVISLTGVIVLVSLALYPQYKIYSMRLHGEAVLKEAEFSRRVAIEEAKAKNEAAQHLAEAEIIRAKGVAQANKILGESLQNNEGYLRYLWIQGLQDGSSEVIYVPTEAGLPILEAGKRK